MFKKLGQFITRHPLVIIAAWIIVLLLAAPLAGMFSERISYNMDTFIPKDLESVKAGDFYKAQFPDSGRSQILVAVVSDNKTASALFIDELNRSAANGSIPNMTGAASIYEVQRDALVNLSPELHTGLHDLSNNTTSASRELYNATGTVLNASRDVYYLRDNVTKINSELYRARGQAIAGSQQMYSARDQLVSGHDGMYQLKAAPDMIYGLPHGYVEAWKTANGTYHLDDTNSSLQAYNNLKASASGPASGYLDAFNGAWNAAGYSSDPDARAKGAISAVFPSVLAGITDPTQKAVFQAAYAGVSYDTYPGAVKAFCVNTALAQGGLPATYKPQLEAVYDLGPNPSGGDYDSLVLGMITAGMDGEAASKARELYYLGNDQNRIGDYVRDSALNAQNNTTVQDLMRDAWNLGPQATDSDFDKYIIAKASKDMNASEKADFLEIYGWGKSPNSSIVEDYVFRKAGKDLNASELDFLHQVYGLGNNPDNATVDRFVVGKVNEELNLTGNLSYMYALLALDRNASKAEVEAFARDWAATHDYANPQLMPDAVVKNLAAGNLTLYSISVTSGVESQESMDSVQTVRNYIAALEKRPEYSGVKAYVTGGPAMNLDAETSSMNDVNNIDKIAIILILLLLGLYFRSFLTPLVPLIIIAIAIVIAFGGLTLLSYAMPIYELIMTFVMVIMLGAGTDYCVFLLSRYSEERTLGVEKNAAIVTAVEHAGKSIASSGTTAMIGFGALLLVDRGIFGGIGISVAIGIFCAILVSITLLPAVLTLVGDRLFWPRKLKTGGQKSVVQRLWAGITRRVLRHSKLILVLALLISIPAVYLVTQISLGNDFVAMMSPTIESKQGFDAINAAMGSGSIDRVMILVTLPENATDASGNYTASSLATLERISGIVAGVNGVDKVNSPTRPEGATINYDNLSVYSLPERGYYRSYMNDSLGQDNRTVVLYAAFKGSPYSEANMKAIDEIRAQLAAYSQGDGRGIATMVGGSPAGTYDYQKSCTSKYPLVYIAVFIGIFLVLATVLRSVFTPLRLIITLLMSVVWTLGAYVLIMQSTLGYVTSWIIPIFLFCALMGLGVDYDIFLVSRVREEVLKGKPDEDAIETAVESTGSIITLCGSVMASAFGSMLLSTSAELQEFGFVLCLAIILDATVIRLVLVPSIMVLMKKYNWWMPFLGSSTTSAGSKEEKRP